MKRESGRSATTSLPSPSIQFPASFLQRVGQLRARWHAARERREGSGGAHMQGAGAEFIGYRPYTAGDDLRALDWNLLARFGEPFVRVSRREACERWSVVLDTSASMGVGRPGKLQLGAELSVAIAALGLTERARVELWTTDRPRPLVIERTRDLVVAMRDLENRRAAGTTGLAAGLTRASNVGRQFLIGDFLDLQPSSLAGRVGRGREVFALALLAPEEFRPEASAPAGSTAVWIDAESGERVECAHDARGFGAYEEALDRHLRGWRQSAARHRAFFGCWSSAETFERVIEQAFRI